MEPTTRLAEELLAHEDFVRRIARRLLLDEHRVDDVVQETWLAAILRRPDERGPIGGWLARVARNFALQSRRDDARRSERESAASRSEAVPSVAEIREREATRHRVVEAVLALDETQRAALVLRFLEGQPPREIARRLGIPVETVKTRLKRGLDAVRARLEAEHGGDGKSFTRALAPLAAVTAMTTKTKAGIAAIALLALAAALWSVTAASTPPLLPTDVSAVATATGAVVAKAAAPPPATANAIAPSETRELVASTPKPAAAPALTGGVRVRVVWGSDKSPAAGVTVKASLPDQEIFNPFRPREITNKDGEALFTSLPAGAITLQFDRGGAAKAAIEAGKTVDVSGEIPPGYSIDVAVVDESGAPIAGVDVWLSDVSIPASIGQIVAKSDDGGRAKIRDVGRAVYVGARSDRHAPSPDRSVRGKTGATVSVRFTLGGSPCVVRGRVMDRTERPVPDAFLRVGRAFTSRVKLEDGADGWQPGPTVVRADGGGRFEARGLPAAKLEVVSIAPGFATSSTPVETRVDAPSDVEIRLQSEVVVEGRVTDAQDRAVVAAQIDASMGGRSIARSKSGANGTFRLTGLPAGTLQLAAANDGGARATTTLVAVEGDALRWNAALPSGLEIRGRVVDEHGVPLAGWPVRASSAPGPAAPTAEARSDADGRFVFANRRDADHDVEAFAPAPSASAFPAASRSRVRPGAEEVVLMVTADALATSHVTGVVVDPDGHAVSGASVTLIRNASGRSARATRGFSDAASGAFRVGPVPSTDGFSLLIEHEGFPDLERDLEKLPREADLELGRVELVRGGRVRVEIRTDDGVRAQNLFLQVTPASDSAKRVFIDAAAHATRAISPALAPGAYTLRAGSELTAYSIVPFEIRAGEETAVEVRLHDGFRRDLRFRTAGDRDLATRVRFAIHDSRSALIWNDDVPCREAGRTSAAVVLAPGDYRLDASTPEGARSETSFEVHDTHRPTETIEIELR